MLAWLKARPDSANYTSVGLGSTSHLSMKRMARLIGAKMTHIPYKGGTPAMTATAAGVLGLMQADVASAMPHIERGSVIPLAVVTNGGRNPKLKDVPTMVELGYPDMPIPSWGGIIVPLGTPAPVIARLAATSREAMADADVQQRIRASGNDVNYVETELFKRRLRDTFDSVGKLLAELNLKVQ